MPVRVTRCVLVTHRLLLAAEPELSLPYGLQLFSRSDFSSVGWFCGVGVFGLIKCIHSRTGLQCHLFKIIIIIIISNVRQLNIFVLANDSVKKF